MDECARFVTRADALYASTSRSQGGINVYACQNVDLLYQALGGREDARTSVDAFVNLFAYVVAFNNTAKSNEFVAERIGHYFRMNSSVSGQGYYGTEVNPLKPPPARTQVSLSESRQYRVEPVVMTRLGRGNGRYAEAVIHSAGKMLEPGGDTFVITKLRQELV